MSVVAKISLHVRNSQLDQQFSNDTREAWRATPELPSSSDFMAEHTVSPPGNSLDTIPASKVEYLRIHYELCRYEAIEPLREAVAEFRESHKMLEGEKAYIYSQVRILPSLTDHFLPSHTDHFCHPLPTISFLPSLTDQSKTI